jgi:hypothetical protein
MKAVIVADEIFTLPQTFPDNEVRKGQLTMELKRLRQAQQGLLWAPDSNELPIVSWESCTFHFKA